MGFLFIGLLFCVTARAVTPTATELSERRNWVKSAFEGVSAEQFDQNERPTLRVVENHDPVQKNARGGKPLRLGESSYTSGLYCHANSKVILRDLPAPAKRFTALVGVDSNEQTSGGRGSVVFIVRTSDGKELFNSGVMHENTPEKTIDIDPGGATELQLIVTDAGDGISCDQADWADAKVKLGDGSTWSLGDLRMDDPASGPAYPTGPVFSFRLDGKSSRDVMKGWPVERSSARMDENRTRRTITYRQPGEGLVIRCDGVEYSDFPTVEWTVYVKNIAAADSPIIEDLRAVDVNLRRDAGGEFLLHHNTGSPCTPTDYQPHVTPLGPKQSIRIATTGGRPTNSDLPFFNIEQQGRGTIVALGWPGQWSAEFQRDDARSLRVIAGQELTHFKLHAGEEVRTPLVVMQFYDGDAIRAQNIWRRWMLAHNTPHIGGAGGKSIGPMTGACSSHQAHEMIYATEEQQNFFIDRYAQEKLHLDYWWMDAGWYVNNGDWPNTGTWEVDRKRFPRGLRAISDHAREKGIKTIVWFEPERVNPGTWLYENHPEWQLGKPGGDRLLNLGDPDARNWWLEHADRLINSEGIDLYRNDFNIDPLPFWRGNDAPDRQGITEIRYVQGFLSYWDELRRRHPDMLIDTCASGGRRNDLETLRRAVPLLRSDFILDPVAQQNHTMGIASGIPFYGTGVNSPDPYTFRSQMCPWITCVYDVRKRDLDYDGLRQRHAQWAAVAPYFLKDFYPLTPDAGEDTHAWVAWQFDDPEKGEGVVLVFRRAESFYESAKLKLRGLESDASYTVTDVDGGVAREAAGKELLKGLSIALTRQSQSALVTYRRR